MRLPISMTKLGENLIKHQKQSLVYSKQNIGGCI